jgi:hypothetical protein
MRSNVGGQPRRAPRIILPLGQVWLSQPLVLGDTDAEIEFESGALAPARHDVRPDVRDESIPDR